MSQSSITRRGFVRTAGAAAASAALAGIQARRARGQSASPNDRPQVLAIGVNGRGSADAIGAAQLATLVGCADVDSACYDRFLEKLAKYHRPDEPKYYRDYREGLARPDIDLVVIGAPDHWHARMIVDCVRAGKDVYCEKPMTLTIAEGQAVCRAVRESGRCVQIGTQQRSEYEGRFLKAVAIARSGLLGKKLTATVKLPPSYGHSSAPLPITEPPATLDWDLWLGPAPKLPYIKNRCHLGWRGFIETGYGPITDWGVHHTDIAQWALGAEHSGPVEVAAHGSYPQEREAIRDLLLQRPSPKYRVDCLSTVYNYDAEMRFANGSAIKFQSLPAKYAQRDIGFELAGENGRCWVSRFELVGEPIDRINADPKQQAWLMEEVVKLYGGVKPNWDHPILSISDIMPTTHIENFLYAARAKKLPISDVFTHHRSNTTCILAHAAALLGRKLTWDPLRETFVGDEEANRLLSRPQRAPFGVQGA